VEAVGGLDLEEITVRKQPVELYGRQRIAPPCFESAAAKALLALAMQDVNLSGVRRCQIVGESAGAIERIIVDDQNVESISL